MRRLKRSDEIEKNHPHPPGKLLSSGPAFIENLKTHFKIGAYESTYPLRDDLVLREILDTWHFSADVAGVPKNPRGPRGPILPLDRLSHTLGEVSLCKVNKVRFHR